MFEKSNEDRLRAWVEFRNTLETSEDPIQDTINLYKRAAQVNIQVDPYNRASWPSPWELLMDNQYCEFATLLGIFYTLQLTARFSSTPAEIHICTNTATSEILYLLFFDDAIIGYDFEKAIQIEELPEKISIETKYTLNLIQ